jgi:type II secretory pathway pseudopilin PulG
MSGSHSLFSFLARARDLVLHRQRAFAREQRGMSLVEVVLATGLLGMSGVAILQAFAALGLSAGHLDRATAADAVAHSVAESILNQTYQNYPGTYSTTTDVANPRTYAVAVQIQYASNPAAVTQTTPATFVTTPATDYGLQRITVTVTSPQGGSARVTRVFKRR